MRRYVRSSKNTKVFLIFKFALKGHTLQYFILSGGSEYITLEDVSSFYSVYRLQVRGEGQRSNSLSIHPLLEVGGKLTTTGRNF